jgi:hypothetical protein
MSASPDDCEDSISLIELGLGTLAEWRRDRLERRRARHASRHERARAAAEKRRRWLVGLRFNLTALAIGVAFLFGHVVLLAAAGSALIAGDSWALWNPQSAGAVRAGVDASKLEALTIVKSNEHPDSCRRHRAGLSAIPLDDSDGCLALHPLFARALSHCPPDVCVVSRPGWLGSMRWILFNRPPKDIAKAFPGIQRGDWLNINAGKVFFAAIALFLCFLFSLCALWSARSSRQKGSRHFWAMVFGSSAEFDAVFFAFPCCVALVLGVIGGLTACCDASLFFSWSTLGVLCLGTLFCLAAGFPVWCAIAFTATIDESDAATVKDRLARLDAKLVNGRRIAERASLARAADAGRRARRRSPGDADAPAEPRGAPRL